MAALPSHITTLTAVLVVTSVSTLIEATSSSCCPSGMLVKSEESCVSSEANFAVEEQCEVWREREAERCCEAEIVVAESSLSLDCVSVIGASHEVISAKLNVPNPESSLVDDNLEILCRQKFSPSSCSDARTALVSLSSESRAVACKHLSSLQEWRAKVQQGLQDRAQQDATTVQVMEGTIAYKWPMQDPSTTTTTTQGHDNGVIEVVTTGSTPQCCPSGTTFLPHEQVTSGPPGQLCENTMTEFWASGTCERWRNLLGAECCEGATTTNQIQLDCVSVIAASHEVISAKLQNPESSLVDDNLEILCRQKFSPSSCSDARTALVSLSSESRAVACKHLGSLREWRAKVEQGLQDRAQQHATTVQVMEGTIAYKWPLQDESTTTTTTQGAPIIEVVTIGSRPQCCPSGTTFLPHKEVMSGQRCEATMSEYLSSGACEQWRALLQAECCAGATTTIQRNQPSIVAEPNAHIEPPQESVARSEVPQEPTAHTELRQEPTAHGDLPQSSFRTSVPSVCCPSGMQIMHLKKVYDGEVWQTCADLEDRYAHWSTCDVWRGYWEQDCCTGHRRRLKSIEEDDEQVMKATIRVAALGVVVAVGVMACIVASWHGRTCMESQNSRRVGAHKVDPYPDTAEEVH